MKYISSWLDRHGKRRYRFRRGPVTEMMRGEPNSPAWLRQYAELLERSEPIAPPPDMSLSALIAEYYKSQEWKALKASTRRNYRSVIEQMREEHGEKLVTDLQRKHVKAMMARMADKPGAANNRLKRLRMLMEFARDLEWISVNPTEGVKMFAAGEIHTWNGAEIEAFENRWPIGTRERLAFALHLYTGQRKSDVRKMSWADIEDGVIRVRQEKTRAEVWVPIHPDLAQILAQAPRNHLLILTTQYGAQLTDGGYGNWFRDACRAAGLPQRCSSHGLRKAAAARLAEAGCSTREIMAVTGHQSLAEVERYTRGAEQKRMAKSAIARLTVKPSPGSVKP